MKDLELVKIEDLKAGDEIILPFQSTFRRYKLLVTPQLSKTRKDRYKSVRCTTKIEEVTNTWVDWKGDTRTYITKRYDFTTPDNHNVRVSVDLNHRQILRIKE